MMDKQILICCALEQEARTIIESFELNRSLQKHPFPIWEKEPILLVVSGIGNIAAASAVSYCAGYFFQNSPAAFLNIGTAGHRDFELGKGFLAHKITCQKIMQRWHPPLIFSSSFETHEIFNVDYPEETFPTNALYEMETAGFYAASLHFTTSELIHCFKIVSDNLKLPFSSSKREDISKLFQPHLPILKTLISEMLTLIKKPPFTDISTLEICLSSFHFTISQKHQLNRLLLRCKTLGFEEAMIVEELKTSKNAQQFLTTLTQKLCLIPLKF